MVHKKSSSFKPKPKGDANPSDAHGESEKQVCKSKSKRIVDLKMMLKKARSIKILEFDGDLSHSKKKEKEKERERSKTPNYMKPTTSSHSRTTDEIKSKGVPSSRPHSSSSHSSGSNSNPHTSKTLMKRLSLRLIRPWMKKSPPAENPVPGKATCSSTLKDSRFAKKLETSEPDGVSLVKVCPYNYCSLNGHHHNPTPPPLTRVISVRRRMLRGQKSMRLKGLSSFKVKGLRKSKESDSRELVISRVPSMRAPLIEDVTDEYFIEIYASNDEPQVTELEECDEILSSLGGLQIEDDNFVGEVDFEVSYEDELSTVQMNVVEDFLEYIDGEGEAEADDGDDLVLISPDFYAEWYLNSCEADAIGKESDRFAESIANCCVNEGEHSNLGIYNDLCQSWDDNPGKHVGQLVKNEEGNHHFQFNRDDSTSFCELPVSGVFAQSDYPCYSEEERVSINALSEFTEREPSNASPEDLMNQLMCEVAPSHALFPCGSSFDSEEEGLNINMLSEFNEIMSADASSEDSTNPLTCELTVSPALLLSDFSSDAEEESLNSSQAQDLTCFYSDSGKERMKIDVQFEFEDRVFADAIDASNSNSPRLGNETHGMKRDKEDNVSGIMDKSDFCEYHIGHPSTHDSPLPSNEDAEDSRNKVLCNMSPGALLPFGSSSDSEAERVDTDIRPEFNEIVVSTDVSSEDSTNPLTCELAVPLSILFRSHFISDDASEFKERVSDDDSSQDLDLVNQPTDALSYTSEEERVSADMALNDLENEYIDVSNSNPPSLDSETHGTTREKSDATVDIIDVRQIRDFTVEDMLIRSDGSKGNENIHPGLEEFVEHDDGTSTMTIQFSHCPQGFHEINLELMDDIDESEPQNEFSTVAGSNMSKAIGRYIRRRATEDLPELRGFRMRGPKFLPEVQDPEAEKVDLKHQETDARKNSEEWMVDYALQRTVSRLARARSRKVRLFVEAFETVMQPCGS